MPDTHCTLLAQDSKNGSENKKDLTVIEVLTPLSCPMLAWSLASCARNLMRDLASCLAPAVLPFAAACLISLVNFCSSRFRTNTSLSMSSVPHNYVSQALSAWMYEQESVTNLSRFCQYLFANFELALHEKQLYEYLAWKPRISTKLDNTHPSQWVSLQIASCCSKVDVKSALDGRWLDLPFVDPKRQPRSLAQRRMSMWSKTTKQFWMCPCVAWLAR